MEQNIKSFPSSVQLYTAPTSRQIPLCLGQSILSNTEPIEGGDDPELEW